MLALGELRDVDRADLQARAGVVQRLDARPGQEDLAPVGADDEAGHGRIAVADRDDQVGDRADRLPGRVANRQADALAQEAHGGHLRGGSVRPRVTRARRIGAGPRPQRAGWTRRVPAGVPARLGPFSTGERSSYGVERPDARRRSGRVSVDPPGTAGQTVPAASTARTIGPCGPSASRSSSSRHATTSTTTSRAPRRSRTEAADGADLVVLPEYVQYRGSDAGFRASARADPGPDDGPVRGDRARAEHAGSWPAAMRRRATTRRGRRTRPS